MSTGDWTPDHWLLVVGFFAMLGMCVLLLVRAKPMQVAGVPSHDLANRMQNYIGEMDQRMRDMPRPREVRELAERVGAMERIMGVVQTDVRAQRESTGRIEHQLNLLIEAGLERERKGS